ncbi:Hypothetical predicted protein [Pelobates cultripes]|uniref:Uncharacterized protein n=1 Tax=Pelobates cultripes TaxID=61616 RepID=A0AAD1R236_PELCU|nr:Hypothetical predicted protein [Pelobates cultripes]
MSATSLPTARYYGTCSQEENYMCLGFASNRMKPYIGLIGKGSGRGPEGGVAEGRLKKGLMRKEMMAAAILVGE